MRIFLFGPSFFLTCKPGYLFEQPFLKWFALCSQIDMVFIGLWMLLYGTGFGHRRTLGFGGQCLSIDG